MDIKIPSAPLEGGAIDAAKEATETAEAGEGAESAEQIADISNAESAQMDSIASIAEQVARGEMEQSEAVDRILADIMDSEMVSAAPAELKQEIMAALENLLETDPTLRSLSAAIGPSKKE